MRQSNVKLKSRRSKGQMFLIGAVVIVSSLLIIKFTATRPMAVKETEALKATFENDIFENVLNELNNTAQFSYGTPLNITRNVFDFANFTDRKIHEHSMNFKFLYVGSMANASTGMLNVSLINMLDTTIDANFTFDGQTDATSGIGNYGKWDTNFTITPGTHYTLTLTYDGTVENITIKTKNSKDVYTGFFYVSMESAYATHRGKYQKAMNIG